MADIPKVRFKGFGEVWERRKLGEITGKIYGGGTPKTSVHEYWDGNIPWIQSSNLFEHELFSLNIQKHITKLGLLKSAAQLIPKNSIAVVSHVGVGKLVFVPFDYTTSQDFISLSELTSNPIFTCYLIYKKLQEDLHIVQGSAIKGITKDDLLSKEVMIPNLAEQEKIGGVLQNLDHLITLHQHKCDETKELKKYMLQKMFPKNGKKIPEIRFSGFTNDWEQRKLGEVFVERTERANGDEELLSVTIGNGVIRQADSDKRIIASEDKSNYKIVRKGDVPYNSMRMWQGAVGNSEYDGIVSPAYTVLVPMREANGKFFMELFKKESTLKIFQRWSQGLTSDTWNLKFPILSSIEFYMPSLEEQTKIAEYFRNLDHLITLHQRKCDELKEVKKFMLQNMFPQKG